MTALSLAACASTTTQTSQSTPLAQDDAVPGWVLLPTSDEDLHHLHV